MSDLYEQDFHAWTDQQARLLRAANWQEADVAHLIEEIESMGRSLSMFADVNERAVILSCFGEFEPFDVIAVTLRAHTP